MAKRKNHIPYLGRNPFSDAREHKEVLPGITLLGSRRINFYAITEGKAVTLVDCGFYGHLRYLKKWLNDTGRTMFDIKGVILTHGHADHLGFASVFKGSGISVHIPQEELSFAASSSMRVPPARLLRNAWRPACMRLLLEAACDSVFLQPTVPLANGYKEGDVFDLPGRPVAISVPGHSVGHSCIYIPSANAVLSGDALMTLDPMLDKIGAIAFAEDPKKDGLAIDALKKLRPYATSALLPGHGEPWIEPGSVGRALDEALR